MARKASISQEEVDAIADKIHSAGGEPAARPLREELGNKGSMGTIVRLLDVWKAKQVRVPAGPIVIPLAIQKAMVDFIAQEVATAKISLELDLVTAQQAKSDVIAESEQQAETIEDQLLAIDGLHSENAELTGRLVQVTADLGDARAGGEAQRRAAEDARTEKAKLELRLEGLPRLEAEIERLRENFETERVGRGKAEQSAAVASARLEKTEEHANDLQSRLNRAEAEARDAIQDCSRMRHQTQSLQESLDVMVKDLALEKEVTRRAEASAAELRGQLLESRGSAK